ncbi:17955_t:CDS:2 [Acaulospora morrowiae]|uniref:17955_t:CDS:1 n=1 Tax=Acaulospora morrowiae TaxID=94023 RepID=A0A9N9DYD1_9GLOM|nr:17955_t:CDS:2 [Acaulospora morrowiae]
MASPNLTTDIINDILDQLTEYDKNYQKNLKDLRSCMLINKHWCTHVIERIWSKPFHYVGHADKRIINTYLSCLEISEKQSLIENMIDVNQISFGLANAGLNKESLLKIKSTFDYPSMLKHLHFRDILISAELWCNYYISKKNPKSNDIERNYLVILEYLLKMISKRSKNLTSIYLYPCAGYDYISLLAEPGICRLFESVRKLELVEMQMLLDGLANVCKNVEYLDISLSKISDDSQATNLSRLISSQTALYTFCCKSSSIYANQVINSISSQSKYLRMVQFHDVNFTGCSPLYGLAKCTKLELLTFHWCISVNYELVKPLVEVEMDKLDDVVIHGYVCKELREWKEKIEDRAVERRLIALKIK